MKKILFIVNTPEFFLSHRLPVALAAKSSGIDVHVATGAGISAQEISKLGFKYYPLKLSRSSLNPFSEIFALFQLFMTLIKIKPDIVHLVTIKPVLYGGVAARFLNIKGVVAAISGLGSVFVSETFLGGIRKLIVTKLYRLALNHDRTITIFQNENDKDLLVGCGAVGSRGWRLIRGSGVDLRDFSYTPEQQGEPVVIMAARLLKEKGVYDFFDAAKELANRGLKVKFQLVGSMDPGNPSSITENELEEWKESGVIDILGFRSDISFLYSNSNIVCLPSYYGEGLPKTLVEAAACGRAIVTTDMPGCRDAIIPNITGILVPAKKADILADTIYDLILDDKLRISLGVAGRKFAEDVFDINSIVNQHIDIYDEFLGDDE